MKVKKNQKTFKRLIVLVIVILFTIISFQLNKSNTQDNILDISSNEKKVETEESEYFEKLYSKNSKDIDVSKNYSTIVAEDVQVHTDPETGVQYVTYEDFGAKYDENFDNYEIMKNTHTYANQYGYEVRATQNTYHIYNLEDTSPILIYTNTNWNGATFIIHDEDIAEREVKDKELFKIDFDRRNILISDENVLKNITVKKVTTNIPQLAGYGNCICYVYNSNKMQYIRSGYEDSTGVEQTDIFKIDNSGNVLNEIQWNFDEITLIRLIPIIDNTITIQNGNFKTILDGREQEKGYYQRNIRCYRSNTILKNITHTVDDIEKLGGPYYGFIRISNTSNVVLENSQLYSHKYKNKSNYDLILENCVNITIKDVTSNNVEDSDRWGITGSNYTKDISYQNCKLNRIDAHAGVHNLNIENCNVGAKGITVVGSGNLNLKNVTSMCSKCLVELRSDYGSTWDGKITIKDCTYKSNLGSLIGFEIIYDDQGKVHDYGYELYLPNLEIDNLIIKNNKRYDSIDIFFNDEENTGKADGKISGYELPKDVLVKNYKTTNGMPLKLFSNKFYNNLEEIGINLSMPLSDKTEIEITNKQGEKIEDQTITNKDIKINKTETEGIATTVKINNEIKNEKEITLKQDGIYEIETIYQNSNGESERKTVNVTIDKTSPSITGATQGKSYKYSVIPKVYDANLKEINLVLNGEEVKSYKEGNELTEEGYYQLTATDKAENTKTISFYILEPGDEDYKIINNNIENIGHYTKKSEFSQKFAFSKEYDILRNNKVLSYSDYIATGDILKTKSGEEYTLIVAGDINKDGKVNIKDIVKLRKYLVSPNSSENKLDEAQLLAADTKIDKKSISIKDLVRMRIIALTTKE